MSRIGIIDMGTNTFHLLLAETGSTGYRIVHRDHQAVRIGKAGINEGIIAEDARLRAIQAMQKFSVTIAEWKVPKVYAFATSALRNAENGGAVAEEITSLTGIPIRIISGDEEADFIYAGVKAALDIGRDASLIMDIGAGSVEFIIGDRHSASWKQSFEIGGQRLLEKFQKHDPISMTEMEKLDAFFEKSLGPLRKALAEFQPRVLIGSSGTFDTLSEIFCFRNRLPLPGERSESPLSIEGFYDIYEELVRKNRKQRMEIPGMIEMRVDMIVVCCCLIRYILQNHRFERIRVSSYSLKEGVLSKVVAGA